MSKQTLTHPSITINQIVAYLGNTFAMLTAISVTFASTVDLWRSNGRAWG